MNIHIIENEKFTQPFLDMLQDYFPQNSNIVYVHHENNYDFVKKKYSFVKFIDSFEEVDLSLANQCLDKIFIHAFYSRHLLLFLYKNRFNIDFKKVVFIAWGSDIYNNYLELRQPPLNFKDLRRRFRTRLYERIKKNLMKKVRLYMTFASGDIDIINNIYGANGIQFDCLYPSTVDLENLNRIKKLNHNNISTDETVSSAHKEDFSNKNHTTTILLGNSATETNQHIEILDVLYKYKNENIKIICPLSYGDKKYALQIKDYGQKLFGDKFIPLLDYLNPVEYTKLLGNVNIAVFNHNRQQATGNIEILSYLGKKIFIRSDISSWKHYVERDKCAFFDTKRISEMSFDEFANNPQQAISTNEKYFLRIWDINYVVSLWKKVMDYNGKTNKRTGILTLSSAENYGAVLQSFSLCKFLNDNFSETEIINFTPKFIIGRYPFLDIDTLKWHRIIKSFIKSLFYLPIRLLKKLRFAKFRKINCNYSKSKYLKIFNNDCYNQYIVGSDQVFNLELTGYEKEFFLPHIKDSNKKATYAASLGVSKLDGNQQKILKEGLQSFSHISIREKTGKELLKKILPNMEITQSIDPVFLTDKKMYESISRKRLFPKKYILIYTFKAFDLAYQIAKQIDKNTNIVYIDEKIRNKKRDVTNAIGVGPKEFLSLIRFAEHIVTDSFHGTAFSIIFNKEFTTIPYKGTESRLTDMLSSFSLEKRIAYSLKDLNIDKINYDRVNKQLKEIVRNSYDYFNSIYS